MNNQKPKKKKLKIVLISIAAVLLIIIGGAFLLFSGELKIIGTVKQLDSEKPCFYMEIDDYNFDEFLKSGGATSDAEVSAFISKKISKGFYTYEVDNKGLGCSTVSAKTGDGSHIFGRNFDWQNSVPIIVKSNPKEGYASISTSDFQNMTGSGEVFPDNIANKMLSIAALYVPLDGINEAGLCVADLEVNEGGMVTNDTDKPNLTVTTAIRLLLDRAATVDEALALLKGYDIFPSGGISHHIAISDASGRSVVVEFAENEQVAVETDVVTNFNLANGDTAAGGESAKQRYDSLTSLHVNNGGVLSGEQVRGGLLEAAQFVGESVTQWSLIFEQKTKTATYFFGGDFSKPFHFSL